MATPPSLAETAAVIGSPARANILTALLDGRSLTAKELAIAAGVSPQTTSGHLAQLTDAHLIELKRQGRNHYYRLASPSVGRMLEAIMTVSSETPRYQPLWRHGAALRNARTCYDHLAGRLGVALADSLIEQGHILLTDDGGEVTSSGRIFLDQLGVTPDCHHRSQRAFCRPCLDWSERRPHLAGKIGSALAHRCFEQNWIAHMPGTRAVQVTPKGRQAFRQTFDLDPTIWTPSP